MTRNSRPKVLHERVVDLLQNTANFLVLRDSKKAEADLVRTARRLFKVIDQRLDSGHGPEKKSLLLFPAKDGHDDTQNYVALDRNYTPAGVMPIGLRFLRGYSLKQFSGVEVPIAEVPPPLTHEQAGFTPVGFTVSGNVVYGSLEKDQVLGLSKGVREFQNHEARGYASRQADRQVDLRSQLSDIEQGLAIPGHD